MRWKHSFTKTDLTHFMQILRSAKVALDVQLPSVRALLIGQSKLAYNRNHNKNLTNCWIFSAFLSSDGAGCGWLAFVLYWINASIYGCAPNIWTTLCYFMHRFTKICKLFQKFCPGFVGICSSRKKCSSIHPSPSTWSCTWSPFKSILPSWFGSMWITQPSVPSSEADWNCYVLVKS